MDHMFIYLPVIKRGNERISRESNAQDFGGCQPCRFGPGFARRESGLEAGECGKYVGNCWKMKEGGGFTVT